MAPQKGSFEFVFDEAIRNEVQRMRRDQSLVQALSGEIVDNICSQKPVPAYCALPALKRLQYLTRRKLFWTHLQGQVEVLTLQIDSLNRWRASVILTPQLEDWWMMGRWGRYFVHRSNDLWQFDTFCEWKNCNDVTKKLTADLNGLVELDLAPNQLLFIWNGAASIGAGWPVLDEMRFRSILHQSQAVISLEHMAALNKEGIVNDAVQTMIAEAVFSTSSSSDFLQSFLSSMW